MAQIIPGTSIHAAVRIVSKPTSVNKPLFYISRSLFENKRLKHRRRIRLQKSLNLADTRNVKTDKRKKISTVVADVTIDLLSDEEPPPPQPVALNELSIVITDSEEEEPSPSSSKDSSKTQKILPMQPDETTVHTEIGNRMYHLSLCKLREGLDSNTISETKSHGKRKERQQTVTESRSSPVALHLSKDLSISLISEDEEEFIDIRKNSTMPQRTHSQQKGIVVGQLPKRCKFG